MYLTDAEAGTIDARIRGIESRTGVQVVTAVVGKSDTYIELPWKAFALGASLAAFGVVLADAWRPEWITANTGLVQAVTMLGVAGAAALLAVFIPGVARLFLRPARRDLEVRQHAQSLFLTHELSRTRRRQAVLIMVSLFERRIEILPDVGLQDQVSEADWRAVMDRMLPLLRRGRPFHALDECLQALEALLGSRGFTATVASADNELPDRPIEERGV